MARSGRWVIVGLAAVALSLVALTVVATPARAVQDSSGFPSITFEYYTYGGQQVELGCGGTDCPSIPVGATVDIRVWVDLYNCDPVTIYFGASGAGSDTVDFNGALSMDFQHTYAAAGVYPVEAVMPTCPGTYTDIVPLTIGGSSSSSGSGGGGGVVSSGPYNDSALFPIAILGFFFGFIALLVGASSGAVGTGGAASNVAGGKVRRGGGPSAPTAYIPFTQPHLEGTPYSMSTHWVSLLDIPIGAQRVDPGRIPFQPGTPTDIFQAPPCPDGCGDLVYTAAGWFCRNPECPRANSGATLTDFPEVGEYYG